MSDQFCILIGNGKFVFAARMEMTILSVLASMTVGTEEFIWIHTLIR